MAHLALAMTIASTAAQAVSTLAMGKAQQQAANDRAAAAEHQARQAEQIAGQDRATAQHEANEERRQGRLVTSRALALAGKSGAGVGDPSMESILGGIGAESEFRALNRLFIGEERARGRRMQADALEFEADQQRSAGRSARGASQFAAFGQAAGGGLNIYDRLRPRTTTLGGASRGLSRYGDMGISPGYS